MLLMYSLRNGGAMARCRPDSFGNMAKAVAASQKIFDLIEKKRTVSDPTKLTSISIRDDGTDKTATAAAATNTTTLGAPLCDDDEEHMHQEDDTKQAIAVQFLGVDFAYASDRDKQVLRNITFDIPARHCVALVGRSGHGKSTIISLLERFYEPTAGQILVFGRDIAHMPLEELRRLVAVVPQEPVMFSESIAANIAYGEAPYDSTYFGARPTRRTHVRRFSKLQRMRIETAARQANAHEFIVKLAHSYDSLVSRVSLSGGQKQRIAIARALYREPKIILLDEFTSALDAESERLVGEALQNVMRGRTVIMISHKSSTIRDATSALVIADGRVIQRGTHTELLSVPGLYRTLMGARRLPAGLEPAGGGSGSGTPARTGIVSAPTTPLRVDATATATVASIVADERILDDDELEIDDHDDHDDDDVIFDHDTALS